MLKDHEDQNVEPLGRLIPRPANPRRQGSVPPFGRSVPNIAVICQSVARALRPPESIGARQACDATDLSDQLLDAVLLIDASPSMDEKDWKPSRLKAAKKAAKTYARRFSTRGPDTRIAVVAYNARATTMCPLTATTRLDAILEAIDYIHTRSCTNITAGLEAADLLLPGTGRPSQVVLLSDGCHNTGPQPGRVASRLRARAIVECVGIADRHGVDEKLLKSIASSYPNGAKRYRWIGDPEALERHLDDLAGGITRS